MSENDWFVLESTPIRNLIGESTFRLPDGNQKRIGGDIHTTVDLNPASPSFGECHSTMRLPGGIEFHG